MKRDLPWAIAIFGTALFVTWALTSVDLVDLWIYDVRPWLTWDGRPAPEPVGEGWRVEANGK